MEEPLSLAREVPEDLAERLFPAAFTCFSEKGYERATMDDVAAAAGAGRATLYYYFRGKEELFGFLLRRGLSMLRAAMDEVAAGPQSGREQLERAVGCLIDLIAEYRHVATVVMQQIGRIEGSSPDAKGWLREQSLGPLRKIIMRGCDDGTLRAADPETAASAIFGGTLWAVLHHAEISGDVPTALVKRQMIDLVSGGLGV